MVKRVQCRVVQSVSLGSGSLCAGPAFDCTQDRELAEVSEPSAGDPDIAKILGLIYNIKCSWLRKHLSNRKARPGRNRTTDDSGQKTVSSNQNPASLGLIVDFVA